jgi:hypothetical protein
MCRYLGGLSKKNMPGVQVERNQQDESTKFIHRV